MYFVFRYADLMKRQMVLWIISTFITELTGMKMYLQGKINPSKKDFLLNNMYKFSSYFTGNSFCLLCKDEPTNAV